VPDDELVVDERKRLGNVEYVSAARAADGSFAVCYFPTNRTVTLNLSKLSRALQAQWFDPTDGSSRRINDLGSVNSPSMTVSAPAKNSAGDADWVLILDATRN
jgi:hypothetical protein